MKKQLLTTTALVAASAFAFGGQAMAQKMNKPSVTAPIASATSVSQLKDIMQAASLKLTADDMKVLDEA